MTQREDETRSTASLCCVTKRDVRDMQEMLRTEMDQAPLRPAASSLTPQGGPRRRVRWFWSRVQHSKE